MTITKPIDLIVAEAMHAYAERTATARQILQEMRKSKPSYHSGKSLSEAAADVGIDIREELARGLLCSISHNAKIADVLKALAAVGAPSTLDFIADGLKAVEDAQ